MHNQLQELQAENSRLSELAEHAEYFANLLKVSKQKTAFCRS